MAEPTEIARHILWLAKNEDEPTAITHLHLQKLLYYSQGWHLAVLGRQLFSGRIEAWKHGPVAPEVWSAFTSNGSNPIDADKEGRESVSLTATQKEIVKGIWDKYKMYSAIALRNKTHDEYPWRSARGGIADDQKCSNEITVESMRSFFVSELQEDASRAGLAAENVTELFRSSEEGERGEWRPYRKVFDELKSRSIARSNR